jgi:cellulose synthase/poly-beta-1,6-N-acetylglucosamine synthase-like glycosyltransferase
MLSQFMIAQIIFFVSVALIAFIYIGYPVLVWCGSRLFAWPVRRADITPSVSVIIAAHNEEQDIAAKIENTLALDYPCDRLEVVVASDCSTDRTDAIVRSYAGQGVILHRQGERHGKTVAQYGAARGSSGEILVFSDATTMYEPDALRKIARNFADPEVGCIAGQLIYVDRAATAIGRGCRSYWGYEKFLKRCESQLGSLIGVSGCLYAVRRSCQVRLAKDMIDDFVIATEIHLQGLRTVYEPEAIAIEDTNQRGRDEFRMRVRVIEQTMNALYRYREVLNPFRHGMFAAQMICHKLLRYTVPVWLLTAFVASGVLMLGFDQYALAFIGQAAFYSAALIGFLGERLKLRLGPAAIPYYFVLINAASLVAFWRFMRGEAQVVWEPARAARDSVPPDEVMIGSHAPRMAGD